MPSLLSASVNLLEGHFEVKLLNAGALVGWAGQRQVTESCWVRPAGLSRGLRGVEMDGSLLCSEQTRDVLSGRRPASRVCLKAVLYRHCLFVCLSVCVSVWLCVWPDDHPVGLKCVAYRYTRNMRSNLMLVYRWINCLNTLRSVLSVSS